MVKRLRPSLALLAALVFLIACREARAPSATSQRTQQDPCDGITMSVELVDLDSTSAACEIVRLALLSLRASPWERSGVYGADTATTSHATVRQWTEVVEPPLEGPERVVRRLILVEFVLPGRDYDAQVSIDQVTQEVDVRRIHKPM